MSGPGLEGLMLGEVGDRIAKAPGQTVFKNCVLGRRSRHLDLIDSQIRAEMVLKIERLHIRGRGIRIPLDDMVAACTMTWIS